MQTILFQAVAPAAAVKAAIRVLHEGGVIALPTETTYGLACDPRNTKAVKKIFRIKGRDDGKPLQLVAASRAQVAALASINAVTKRMIARHWPGPLTLLLPLKKGIKLAAQVSPQRTVGIRVSSSAFVRSLARAYGHPIAATSANRSGNPPAFSGKGVVRAFQDGLQPDLLIDAGMIPRNKPSTVAQIHSNGRIEILRQGTVRIR